MKEVKIGYDNFLKKDIIKLKYDNNDLPRLQVFNSDDVISGNPSSNVAIGFVYTWKTDKAPEIIRDFFVKVSNYASITGFWKTTNGAKYVFSNILGNPNINKLVLFVFDEKDNGHMLVDALTNFWKNGTDENGIIIGSKAGNPKFEQVPLDALERLKKQCDLIVFRNIKSGDFDKAEDLIKAQYQEPDNAIDASDFGGVEFYSEYGDKFYDCGARFNDLYYLDLSAGKKPVYEKKDLSCTIGQSVQAETLIDALEIVSAFVFKNGEKSTDQRGITTIESRSFSITIVDAIKEVPDGFSKEYINTYVDEFLNGVKNDDCEAFVYTYHDRIFKTWGNQVEKVIDILSRNPNTRRAMISLWDQKMDLESSSPPCLDFIWVVIRGEFLEFHVVFRSHHLSTVTPKGIIQKGEGAFVPNMYALGKLQEIMSEKLNKKRGSITVTDFSGHLYVSGI